MGSFMVSISFIMVFINLKFCLSRRIPDYIPICRRSDPQYEKCVLKSIEAIRPYLLKGIPKIKVPPSEPLIIPTLEISRNSESIEIIAKMTDIRVYGSSTFVPKRLKIDLSKYLIEITIHIPKLYITSQYDVDGRVLIVPMRGQGVFKGNFTNVNTELKASAKAITDKKGFSYLQIENIVAKVKIEDMTIKLSDTDTETAPLIEAASSFIEQNKKDVLEIFAPVINDSTETVAKIIVNNIFKSMPLHEMLPD